MRKEFSRRDFLKASGVLVVSFSVASPLEPFATAQGPFGTHASHINPEKLDSWHCVHTSSWRVGGRFAGLTMSAGSREAACF